MNKLFVRIRRDKSSADLSSHKGRNRMRHKIAVLALSAMMVAANAAGIFADEIPADDNLIDETPAAA